MTSQEAKKDRPALPEAAQGLTTTIISYVGEKSSIVSVIPDSIYHFKKLSNKNHVYLLESMERELVEKFPSTYQVGVYKGRQYITYRDIVAPHLKWRYSQTLELKGAKKFTGLNMKQSKDGIYRGYGDDRDIRRRDCILVALSADRQNLDISFVFGKADKAKEVYQAWLDDVKRRYIDVQQE